jgi:hypothetical protein
MKKEINQKEIEPKEGTITFEYKQCSARIPQSFRHILKLKKGDKIAWSIDINTKELFGYLIKSKKRK